jgi:uncharacterized protein YjiS (DUF1127 family)
MMMDLVTLQPCPRPGRASLRDRLRLALAIRRQRRRLTELDPHLLRDIGLSDADVRLEANRPFWDVPQHWLR